MTPEQAAELLGLTVAQLLAHAGDGEIPGAILETTGWRFTRAGLERFLKRHGKAPRQDDAA